MPLRSPIALLDNLRELTRWCKETEIASNVYTVATLPDATKHRGVRAIVTDANATTFASTVAAGGANIVPVFSNGTDWKIG